MKETKRLQKNYRPVTLLSSAMIACENWDILTEYLEIYWPTNPRSPMITVNATDDISLQRVPRPPGLRSPLYPRVCPPPGASFSSPPGPGPHLGWLVPYPWATGSSSPWVRWLIVVVFQGLSRRTSRVESSFSRDRVLTEGVKLFYWRGKVDLQKG